jgi:hypothetical protein
VKSKELSMKFTFYENELTIFIIALSIRLITWILVPIDWNWDSYHHWQISYLSLHIGFRQGRLWDLNGCEYIWGIVPHLIQSTLLFIFNTNSILLYRIFNLTSGSFNSVLVYKIGNNFYNPKIGLQSGFLFAVFPIAAIFDITAMQDTIAITFLLSSLYLIKDYPFLSGLLLALSGQSRVELFLVGLIILLGYMFRERVSTNSQPFIIGYFVIFFIFGLHLYHQTGNPVYPLYYSFYNVFGGFIPENRDTSFTILMLRWLYWKLSVWPKKFTGIMILSAIFGMTFILPYMAWRKWSKYQPILYTITTLSVLSPIFLTYVGSDFENLLIMLRMVNPIIALSIPLILNMIYTILDNSFIVIKNYVFYLLLIILIGSFGFFLPHYSPFQQKAAEAYFAADKMYEYYDEGTIVSDYPTINYKLIQKHNINPINIIGNHYSPNYYGIHDPFEYALWLDNHEVTLWTYWDERAKPVWDIISKHYPGLFVIKERLPAANIYKVDQAILRGILENSNN